MRIIRLYVSIAFCIISAYALQDVLARAEGIGFEGIQWRLVEVGGVSVSLPANAKPPYMMFDQANKKVTGYGGCNNFFAGYERDGGKLKFGPVGSTRRACPNTETALEAVFFMALANARGWNITDGRLQLIDDENVLARFTMTTGDSTAVDPGSMTYISPWLPSGKVILSHGECRMIALTGSVSEIVVRLSDKRGFGVIDGNQAGVVILATDLGGSGTFYDLALITKDADGWANRDVFFLGDRVKVHSVAIEDNHVVVSLAIHGPDDPLCCPALEVKQRFAVRGGRLVPSTERK